MSDTTMGNRKNILWRLLKNAFLKARQDVRQRGGAPFRVPSPEHFAIDVLNEHYGKRKAAKPRNYTSAELDHAIIVAQSEGFLKALEEAITDAMASREKQTPQVEAPVTVEPEKEESLEPVKPLERGEVHRLRDEIERAGGEVRSLKDLREGLYAVEVATPLAVYWGTCTREEILRQVEHDVLALESG
jgi:hypothetical protein